MKEIQRYGRAAIFFIALLLIFLGGALAFLASRAQEHDAKRIATYLLENTAQQAAVVQGRLREQLAGLSTLASYIAAEKNFSLDACGEVLKKGSVNKYYKRLGIITPEGTATYSDDVAFQANQNQVFLRAVQGRSSISPPLQDNTDLSTITVMTAPLFKDHKVIGVLAAHFPVGFFKPQLRTPLLGSTAMVFLMDMHGIVLDQTTSPLPGRDTNYLTYLTKTAGNFSKTPQEIAEDMKQGKSGVVVYATSGGTQHLAYAPVGEAEWYAATLLPERALASLKSDSWLTLDLGLRFVLVGIMLFMPAAFFMLTAKQKKRTALTLVEQRFASVADCVNGGFLCCAVSKNMPVLFATPGISPLLGYSHEELFHLEGGYLNCVLEQDRFCLLNVMGTGTSKSISTEYRLQRKDGSIVWVRDRRRRSVENGQAVWHCVINDTSERMLALEQQSLCSARIDSLLAVTDSMLFDYNLANDVLLTSTSLSNRFSVQESPFVFEHCDDFCLVHPDDKNNYLEVRKRLLGGSVTQDMVLRVRDVKGAYQWQNLRLHAVQDRRGACAHVVGSLTEVPTNHDLDEKDVDLEHDALTGLLLQGQVQRRVNAYAIHSGEDGNGALCLVDVDGFRKLKNEYGPEATDKLVQELAQKLQELFRPTDILGRIGHDQFPIFMKELEKKQHIIDKFEEIHKLAAKGFSCGNKRVSFSISMGIALFPEHGRSYDRLLHHADLALSIAKQQGGGMHAVFEG